MSNGNPWPSLGLKECLSALKESELWQNRQTNENEGWGVAVGLAMRSFTSIRICQMAVERECSGSGGICRYFRNQQWLHTDCCRSSLH